MIVEYAQSETERKSINYGSRRTNKENDYDHGSKAAINFLMFYLAKSESVSL